MTEQEAEAFAKRLERVWGSDSRLWFEQVSFGMSDTGVITFTGNLGPNQFELERCPPHGNFIVHFYDVRHWSSIRYDSDYGQIDVSESIAAPQNWGNEAPPIFRRGCWLSGCGIEASAHEKAEWIQGFSHEELEAWNLKI
ncbi:MAG: hypothetical protein EOP06_31885 [Proteobacteria bacterium]|nr:MAG: hypothetical protein EOP06_31885 [Pseudomonadota bacterium]